MIELANEEVLVVGLGSSGVSAARLLSSLDAKVHAIDSSSEPLRADFASELDLPGVIVETGIEMPPGLSRYALLVVSPGVPDRAPVLQAAREAGIPVISELELGYRVMEEYDSVAITGTNGKTTTTELVGRMLSRTPKGGVSRVCGNIGEPVTAQYGFIRQGDILIMEVSSFQLQNIDRFRARVSVLLNIAPDHYDWHSGYPEYCHAKSRIISNMREDDLLVYNMDDPETVRIAGMANGVTAGFSLRKTAGSSIWVEGGEVRCGAPFEPASIMPLSEFRLIGPHNLENLLAATAAAVAVGQEVSVIREQASSFNGLPHRVEYVAERDGIRFFNDSKATNPHATMSAFRSFGSTLVPILGGRNKGLSFREIAFEVRRRLLDESVSGVVLYGECAGEIKQEFEEAGICDHPGVIEATTMDEAVQVAFSLVGERGFVLFSPATASFDMFNDYEDRGEAFKDSVMRFVGGSGSGHR